MKLDPVGRWRSDEGRVRRWKEIVETDDFRSAIHAVLLEFQSEACARPEGSALILGANKLAARLLELGDTQPKEPPRFSCDLPHPSAGT